MHCHRALHDPTAHTHIASATDTAARRIETATASTIATDAATPTRFVRLPQRPANSWTLDYPQIPHVRLHVDTSFTRFEKPLALAFVVDHTYFTTRVLI